MHDINPLNIHVYIASIGPRPILDLYTMCKLALLFGCLTITTLRRQYAVEQLTHRLSNFLTAEQLYNSFLTF